MCRKSRGICKGSEELLHNNAMPPGSADPASLARLSTLMVVAEKRSFTAAAAVLGVTPSAVSQTVRALEARLGVRLLQRTTRSVGLTEVGARFLARLRPAMAGVQEAFDGLGELRDRPAGVLRLSLPRLGYEQLIEPRLPEFLAAYPDIQLELSIDEAFVDIVERGFDAGLRIGEMLDREMVAVRLSPDLTTAIVGAPSYFARRGKPRHPRELLAHDCINYRQRTKGGLYRWELVEDGEDFELAVEGRLAFDDGELMTRAALAGLGVAYLMDCAVHEHLAAKRLVRVLEPYSPSFPGFFLYYPSRAHLALKLAAFASFFRLAGKGSGRRAAGSAARRPASSAAVPGRSRRSGRSG